MFLDENPDLYDHQGTATKPSYTCSRYKNSGGEVPERGNL